jgi:hypothetical protein
VGERKKTLENLLLGLSLDTLFCSCFRQAEINLRRLGKGEYENRHRIHKKLVSYYDSETLHYIKRMIGELARFTVDGCLGTQSDFQTSSFLSFSFFFTPDC